MDVNTLSASFDPSGIESGAGRAKSALEALKAASLQTASAFDSLEAASPKRTQGAVRELANAVKGSFSQMEQAIKPMSAAIATMQKELEGLAVNATKSGKATGSGFASGVKEGAEQAVATVRSERQKMQAEYEAMRALNARFKPGALENLRASGVTLSDTDGARLFEYQSQRKFDAALAEAKVTEDRARVRSTALEQAAADRMELDEFRRVQGAKVQEERLRIRATAVEQAAADKMELEAYRRQQADKAQADKARINTTALEQVAADRMELDEFRRRQVDKAQADKARIQSSALEQMAADKMELEAYRRQQAEKAQADKARLRSVAQDAAFISMSPVGQVQRATRVSAATALGMSDAEAVERYGAAALTASRNVDSLRDAHRSAGVQARTQTEQQRALNAAMYEGHSAARGLASGFGAMWLTWGSIVPLIAGAAVSAGFVQTIKMGAEVQQSLTTLKVLGEESATSVANLNAQMMSLAREGQFGPREIAEAMKTLTLAGLDAVEVGTSLKDVMNFSVAGEVGLKDGADTLTTVAKAFGVGADNFSYVGDIIARAAADSKASVTDMSNAFKTASAINQQFGVTLEDTAVGLELLHNAGIRGTAAGTSLRNMVSDLSGRTKHAAAALKELGVEALDAATGKVKPLDEVMRSLLGKIQTIGNPIGAGKYLQTIFDERGAKEAFAIFNALQTKAKDTGESVLSVYEKLKEGALSAGGFSAIAAAEIALTPLNQMKSTAATLESSLVETFDSLQPYLISVASDMKKIFSSEEFKAGLRDMVVAVGSLVSWTLEHAKAIGTVAAAYVGLRSVITLASEITLAWRAVAAAEVVAAEGAAAVGVATRLASAANPLLLALSAAVGLAAAAWAGYTMWAGEAAKTTADASGPRAALLDNLRAEEQRIKSVNEARRQGISLQELEARNRNKLESAPAIGRAQAAVDVARTNLNNAKLVDQSSVSVFAERLRAAEAVLQSERGASDKVESEIAKVSESIRAENRSLADATRKELDDKQRAMGKLFTGSSDGPVHATAGRGSKDLKIAQEATSDILKLYQTLNKEATQEAAHAVKAVDTQYALGLLSFKEAEDEKDQIRRNALTSSRTLLQLEVEAAEAGAKRLKAAAEAANRKKPGSVKPEEVEHGLAGFTSKVDEARQALKKLDDDSEEAANAALVRRSKPLVEAAKAAESLRNTAAVELDAVKAESEYRTSLLGLSEAAAAVEAARYKESQRFLKAELVLRGEIEKFREGDSVAALERAKAELKKLQDAKPSAVDAAGDVVQREQDKLAAYKADPFNGIKKALDDYHTKVRDVASSTQALMTKAFQGMEDALVAFTKTGKLDFSSLADSIVTDLIRIGIQKNITGPLSGAATSGAASLMSLLFSANGNAFDSGGLVPFANGGVFDSPTAFSFGGNKLGVLGEAGSEAVMPLARGSDGRLGVTSQGGGGASVNVTVNVIEDSSKAGTQSRRDGGKGDTVIDVFVEKVKSSIAGDISKGSGAVPSALASTYGLNRVVSGY